MKKHFWMIALMASMAISASAETLPEVEEVEATQEKATVEIPAWVNNIKFQVFNFHQKNRTRYHHHYFQLQLFF